MKAFILALVFVATTFFALSGFSLAESYDPGAKAVCDKASGSAFCGSSGSGNPISGSNGVIPQIIDVISLIAGSVAVIMVIIGGIKFTLSNGDPAKAASGRQTVLFALIGLVIVLFAQAIISFAVRKLT